LNNKESRKIWKWMEIFKDLYAQSDSRRTPEQMWIAVMAHSSQIGESIRKFAFDDLLYYAAHTFCWLCSFVNKCNSLHDDIFSIKETLSGIVSLKYPKVCGLCKNSICECDPVKVEEPKNKAADYKELLCLRKEILKSFEDYDIANFQKIFGRIYGGRIHIQTIDNIGFHFLEEIGEAAVYIRKLSQLRTISDDCSTGIDLAYLNELLTVENIVDNYYNYYDLIQQINSTSREERMRAATIREPRMLKARVVEAKMGLVVEIADSFSWFCSVLNKLRSMSESIRNKPEDKILLQSLEEKLNDEYINSDDKPRCPTCKKNPCECVFFP